MEGKEGGGRHIHTHQPTSPMEALISRSCHALLARSRHFPIFSARCASAACGGPSGAFKPGASRWFSAPLVPLNGRKPPSGAGGLPAVLRSGGDSNPRYRLMPVRPFSKRLLSASQPPLQMRFAGRSIAEARGFVNRKVCARRDFFGQGGEIRSFAGARGRF